MKRLRSDHSTPKVPCDVMITTTTRTTVDAFLLPLIEELSSRGMRVHLVVGDAAPNSRVEDAIHRIPMVRGISPLRDARALLSWISLLNEIKPPLLICATPKASLLSMLAAAIVGVPDRTLFLFGAVWDGASGGRRLLLECSDSVAIACSTRVLSISPSLRGLCYRRGITKKAIDLVGAGSVSGVDLQRFLPLEEPGPCDHISYIGRIHADKGLATAIRALDAARAHFPVRLRVVGALDVSNPPPADVVDALRNHPYIDWVGQSDEVERYLQDSLVLLLPSSREGHGQIALEAQASGVPVIGWRVTGVVDSVEDGVTGILCDFQDEQAFFRALILLLGNPDLRAQMGRSGRAYVEANFEEAVVSKSVVDYFLHTNSQGCMG